MAITNHSPSIMSRIAFLLFYWDENWPTIHLNFFVCNLWGMKLNASKTKTMIVSRLRTVHPLLSPLTLDGTVLKESADLVILGVTFDAKMTFEKHLRSVSSAAAQRLVIMRKSW